MAAGDVTHDIVDTRDGTSAINTAVAALRNGANDKWFACPTGAPGEVIVFNVEEA